MDPMALTFEGEAMLKTALFVTASMLMLSAVASDSFAQSSPSADWAIHTHNSYRVLPNITYMTATGYESKLDVYRRRDTTDPQPTLIFYHGGGWVAGTKDSAIMSIMPWLEMSWTVVNVEYRMAAVALAPAAVVDATCALRIVIERAEDYGIDSSRIVVSGESVGGHLALAVGMIPETAGFTHRCAGGGFGGIETAAPQGCGPSPVEKRWHNLPASS